MEEANRGGAFERIRRITESDAFESVVVTLLVLNAGALALELFADVSAWETWFWLFFVSSQAVFIGEISLRVFGYGPRFSQFFADGWNLFDFVVVALSLVPLVGSLSFVARMIRVLRVLRVVSYYGRRRRREVT